MHVDRIGFTPLKGGRHVAHPAVDLVAEGPVGDRLYCLVDPARNRVLRTVENPVLLQTVARHGSGALTVTLPGGTVSGDPEPTGEVRKVDYWGRVAEVELLDGPWGEAYSAHLGYDVRLARPRHTAEVVYGGSVTLVATAALDDLAERVGSPVDGARFRATFLVATPAGDPLVEQTWVGRELAVGGARLRVRGVVPRCAVVDLDPVSGTRDAPVLQALAGYRRGEGFARREPSFGIDADVARPGRVEVGDRVALGKD